MAIFRTYSKAEQAYTDAALLCEMGLDAVVVEDRAYGGNILGATSASIRIEMPEEQFAEATSVLSGNEPATHPLPSAQAASAEPAPPSTAKLRSFLRLLLVFDLVFEGITVCLPEVFSVEVPQEVENYFKTLVFSDALWRLAYLSYWPLFGLTVIANLLCLADLKLGRTLYAWTIGWSILSALGFPPHVASPVVNLLGTMQWSGACIALALMYWSPLKQSFVR